MTKNEFLQAIDGRTVAIVGNGKPDRDYSAEIDAADVVVRFNHFYNYSSGMVGRKVDVVFQIFTGAWEQAADKNAAAIRECGARIFTVRKPEQYSPALVARHLGSDVCVSDLSEFFREHNDFTCGGTVLTTLASLPLNSKVRCYCFPQGKAAEEYFTGPAKHYTQWRRELAEQARAIELLERCEIRRERAKDETVILVPVKASSSGAPGKNELLLPHLLGKLRGLPYRTVLVGKADDLAGRMRERFGVEYFRSAEPTGEVTDDLRLWRDYTDYCGEVVLLQATAPNFRAAWIDRLVEARRHAPVAAICERVGFKVNGIYGSMNGVYAQLVGNFGAPSVPRQRLPECVHLTGGGFAFHSDALSRASFFNAGTLRPVLVEGDDALDVDTAADLEKAKAVIG